MTKPEYVIRTFKAGLGWNRWGYEVAFADGRRRAIAYPRCQYSRQVHARAAGIARARKELGHQPDTTKEKT